MDRLRIFSGLTGLVAFGFAALSMVAQCAADEPALRKLEKLASSDPKPFVIVEASGAGSVIRGQGVVISPDGHVLTCGHVSWDKANETFVDRFRVSFRGTGQDLPSGFVHTHKTIYRDREDVSFWERFYTAAPVKKAGSRFLAGEDLGLLSIRTEGKFPTLSFYSEEKPTIQLGETFHLCHYNFPDKPASPTLLINPVKIVGVAQTSSGLQYLAEGYYRVGSSGGAILKDGRLIGIQSARVHGECEGCWRSSTGIDFISRRLGRPD